MNIGKISKAVSLPSKTLRYYDDIGLVRADRSANGYRQYREQHIGQLLLVKRARDLGFSIDDCRALLTFYHDPNRASADVKAVVESRIVEIDQKIQELHLLKQTLQNLAQPCKGDHGPDCPIIDSLSSKA